MTRWTEAWLPAALTRWTILRGRVTVRQVTDPRRAVSGIVRALEQTHPGQMGHTDHHVWFGWALAPNLWSPNVITTIGRGDIHVSTAGDGVTADYTLDFSLPFAAETVMGVGFALFALLGTGDLRTSLILGGSLWLFGYGAHVVIATLLFPRWLRNALKADDGVD